MKTVPVVLGVSLALAAACAKGAPKQDTFPGPQLGESRKSPGADPTKQSPVTPDDPRAMNVSAAISPEQAAQAAQAPAPAAAPSRESATSSTPVTQPRDIAPPSTTTDANRPTVTSPPPPTTR